MEESYPIVKLLQNKAYPTYQLYAQMAKKKMTPEKGLRFAALTTLQWVKRRLGEHVPPDWENIPDPAQYDAAGDDCLFSQHINQGYVIDIVSLPKQGMWSLQITEPDLGPNPGQQDQKRPPVAGRVIETNVAFRIADQVLYCGFQTVVSDPEGAAELAEVYRLAIIRQLANEPKFGLKQITPLTGDVTRIKNPDQVNELVKVWHNAENQLPCVLFTQVVEEPAAISPPFPVSASMGMTIPPITAPADVPFSALNLPDPRLPLIGNISAVSDPPYDVRKFAKSGVTFCRTYLLEEVVRKRFESRSGLRVQPGEVIVLEPDAFGGKTGVYPLKQSGRAREETMRQLREAMFTYPRGKDVSFGRIAFLTAAHGELLRQTDELKLQSKNQGVEWQQSKERLDAKWKAALAEKDAAYEELSLRLARQREFQAQLEAEKTELREQQEKEIEWYKQQIADRDEDIRYLRRKLTQPTDHEKIASWVREQLGEHLVLHQRAVELLADRSAKTVDVGLICDALDFLATDYWDCRYKQITEEEMLTRCSAKYGRPFDIAPTGSATTEKYPGEYKIKYSRGEKGKTGESTLDYHLRVGNDAENLVRIYFLHDDEKKLIVVGSLPRHLKTATIQ